MRKGVRMNTSIEKVKNNMAKEVDILNTPEYKSLPVEKQLEIAQFMATKNMELNAQQKQYLLEHMSSDHDTAAYLNFLDQQNHIVGNAKGVNMSYSSYETKTPTGKISSKTTHATASTGCLIPLIATIMLITFFL